MGGATIAASGRFSQPLKHSRSCEIVTVSFAANSHIVAKMSSTAERGDDVVEDRGDEERGWVLRWWEKGCGFVSSSRKLLLCYSLAGCNAVGSISDKSDGWKVLG